jgi:predicted permease
MIMRAFRRLLAGFVGLVRRDRMARDVDEELRAYFDASIEEKMRGGMPVDDARRAARLELGSAAAIKDSVMEVGWESVVESTWLDLRYGVRGLIKAPGFTATVVLTLALAIGATTAIFSLLDAVLLKSLPVRDPERLVLVGGSQYPVFQAFQQTGVFVDLLATSGVTSLDSDLGDGQRQRAAVSLVSGSYFSTLGVPAVIGRTLSRDDDRVPGQHPVAVVSHRYWQERLGRDPNVAGRTIRISATPITIVGVAPSGFFGEEVGVAPDLWMPLTMWGSVVPGRNLLQSPGTGWLRLIGRVPPGAPVSGPHPRLTAIFKQVLTDVFGPVVSDDLRRDIDGAIVSLQPAAKGRSAVRTEFGRPLVLLMGAAALVLLIACANIANLLLARSAARRREIDTRLALGMTRARLLRQLFTESLVLAGAGGTLGVLVAWVGREALLRLISSTGSRLPLEVSIDGRFLLAVAAISLATALVFGLAPAWKSSRAGVAASLVSKHDAGGPRQRLRPMLVVAQVAVSLVLLMGAGLFLQTLANLAAVDLGVAADRLLVVELSPQRGGTVDEQTLTTTRGLLQRIQAVPGVVAATISQHGVLSGSDNGTNLMRPEGFVAGREGFPRTRWDVVGPGYFTTVGAPLRAGRDFTDRDDAGAPPVTIINSAMARLFFADQDPVGRRLTWDPERPGLLIVGVAHDLSQGGPRAAADARFYLPYLQLPQVRPGWALGSTRFIVRAAVDPETLAAVLRREVLTYDSSLSVTSVSSGTELVRRTLIRERTVAALLLVFGALAVGLACLGMYGLIACLVAQRTAEIGLRIALGAPRAAVLRVMLRRPLLWIVAGIAIGTPLALAASRGAESLVFGVATADPRTLLAAAVVILVTGFIAAFIPSRRALRVDPLVALRAE